MGVYNVGSFVSESLPFSQRSRTSRSIVALSLI